MSYISAGIAGASLIVGAAGTTMSFLGQQGQAAQAESIAAYNRAIAEQNNKISLKVAQRQAKYKQRQFEMQAQASRNNATTLRGAAGSTQSQGREQARRMRLTNDKAKSTQIAHVAKSGVTSEGSPLAVMAETAALMELGVQDMAWQTNNQAEEYLQGAREADYQAESSLFSAEIAKYEGAAAKVGFQIGQNSANADFMAGQSQAAAYRGASYGTLLSGFGNALDAGGNIYGSTYKVPTRRVRRI